MNLPIHHATVCPVFRLTIYSLLCAASLCSTAAANKKFIQLGWDIPDTTFLRAHGREMEQEGPFDGVIFSVDGRTEDGKKVGTESGWNREPWKREWFSAALADLKACQFNRFTHNFIRFNATPKLLEWDDDEGWRALADKLRICAWVAREGGARGIAPDFEPYGENQWKFDPAKGRTFADASALARERGAQCIRGLGVEMPNAVILTLFLNSVVLPPGRADDPDVQLAREHYGLLPAFFNGMLDAAPPAMIIVDGCEGGYYMDSVEAYQRAALDMRSWNGPAIKLVVPENRAKYRQQVQAGFGFYLDMFVNEAGHTFYRPPLDGSRLRRLSRNLCAARDATDEYVWIYGEQCRWWSGLAKDKPWREEQLKRTVGKGRTWEEAMPGIRRVIHWARDPDAAARAEVAELKSRNSITNLAVNGDFRVKPQAVSALPPGWSAWQHEKNPTGKFAWDESIGNGSVRATKVAWGCFIQKIAAVPGQAFVVQAACHARGTTMPGLTIRWQTSDHKWTREADDRSFAFQPGTNDWRNASAVVMVPPDAGQVVVLLDVRNQGRDNDVCWFDNVEVYRLEAASF